MCDVTKVIALEDTQHGKSLTKYTFSTERSEVRIPLRPHVDEPKQKKRQSLVLVLSLCLILHKDLLCLVSRKLLGLNEPRAVKNRNSRVLINESIWDFLLPLYVPCLL